MAKVNYEKKLKKPTAFSFRIKNRTGTIKKACQYSPINFHVVECQYSRRGGECPGACKFRTGCGPREGEARCPDRASPTASQRRSTSLRVRPSPRRCVRPPLTRSWAPRRSTWTVSTQRAPLTQKEGSNRRPTRAADAGGRATPARRTRSVTCARVGGARLVL
ncbi:hypothetical protein NDU88_008088 [Pleurodeles waltl]|uniref:Uncharacterized protein n=1 Tax=Pleurodeles waltl TaxID=8319 RepID=A0AAV7NY46_PLEWA|nr:hypothetical protein NDU88_008088 [Pleurodeles waltl]